MKFTLYKYRGISENTYKIFTDQKIWLSNAEGLNDPFECSIQEIAGDFIKEKVIEMKKAHIIGFVHSSIGTTDPTKKTILRKIRKADSIHEKHKILQKALKKYAHNTISNPINVFKNFDKQLNNAGIFSLSEDSINELMWAHYGDQHKGLAIGFEIDKNSQIFKEEKILKVNYSNELPSFSKTGFKNEIEFMPNGINKQRIAFNDKSFQYAISTKSPSWAYEKEWRYVEPSNGLYPHPGKIVEIIFGLRMTSDDRMRYKKLISGLYNQGAVKYFEIVKESNSNRIEKVDFKSSH